MHFNLKVWFYNLLVTLTIIIEIINANSSPIGTRLLRFKIGADITGILYTGPYNVITIEPAPWLSILQGMYSYKNVDIYILADILAAAFEYLYLSEYLFVLSFVSNSSNFHVFL